MWKVKFMIFPPFFNHNRTISNRSLPKTWNLSELSSPLAAKVRAPETYLYLSSPLAAKVKAPETYLYQWSANLRSQFFKYSSHEITHVLEDIRMMATESTPYIAGPCNFYRQIKPHEKRPNFIRIMFVSPWNQDGDRTLVIWVFLLVPLPLVP